MAAKKEAKTFRIFTSVYGVNLRKEPSQNAEVIRIIPNGEEVKAGSKKAPEGWTSVEDGFVMSEYLI